MGPCGGAARWSTSRRSGRRWWRGRSKRAASPTRGRSRPCARRGGVPRPAFVPEDLRAAAYEDRPLPIGEGQTISQPYMVAAMTAALDPPPDGRVLEVGTGSGYQAAVLADLP